MKDVKLDNERERHWRMVFKENKVGIYEKKHCYMRIDGMYT